MVLLVMNSFFFQEPRTACDTVSTLRHQTTIIRRMEYRPREEADLRLQK